MPMATMKPSLALVEKMAEDPVNLAAAGERDGGAHSASALHDRFNAMRQMLENSPQASAAEALAMLRKAFPETALSDRVRALGFRDEA